MYKEMRIVLAMAFGTVQREVYFMHHTQLVPYMQYSIPISDNDCVHKYNVIMYQ